MHFHTAVVGGGFAGLAAAYELARNGKRVIVIERDPTVGGLAGGFDIGGHILEKFYHHWFNNDQHIFDLIHEMDADENILLRQTRTGMYYSSQFFRLSTPIDLLRFKALPFFDRIRLGVAVLRARSVKDWSKLEGLSAKEWLIDLCGQRAYDVVWDPLLVGKFGSVADDVSAVWFWKKLVLRGGSRSSSGGEVLAYYKGGFAALADRIALEIRKLGGEVLVSTAATRVLADESGRATGVQTAQGVIYADNVLLTTALPITADLLGTLVTPEYIDSLRRIRYLSNVCLVLALNRSLSDTYWLNVNDPRFPFVGVIEHTNFEPPSSYGGHHIVYLSKYLPPSDPMYEMDADQLLEFSIPHIQRMFPEFKRDWIDLHYVWRADYAQPIAEKNYSALLPPNATALPNVMITTMAQVYPEDRGTNYAVREGRQVARLLMASTHSVASVAA
jgi:protoporphyrinogen oxidase